MSLLPTTGVSTRSADLERWLGREKVAELSHNFRGWYGSPVPLAQVPGRVFACGDGDFIGSINGGREASIFEFMAERVRKQRLRMAGFRRRQLGAFSGIDGMIAAATGGKLQNHLQFSLNSPSAGAPGRCVSFFLSASTQPAQGSIGAAAPGGTVNTSSSVGALAGYQNGASTNSNHFLSAFGTNLGIGVSMLLYDRLFSVAKTMSSTATEAVTGTPNRYTNTTPGTVDYCQNNFVFPEISSTLGATSHNWTVCQYTNQAGATAKSFPSIAGLLAGGTGNIDLANNNWFMPLASGDSGVSALTQMQCSASVTGTLDFVIGHPISVVPFPLFGCMNYIEGLYSCFNLSSILDNACLTLISLPVPQLGVQNIAGMLSVLSE